MQPNWIPSPQCLDRLHADHPRSFGQNRFVYPVLSRRARGISVGLNLNPDKLCNFDCVYCQVDRQFLGRSADLRPEILLKELEETLLCVNSGRIYDDERFAQVPQPLRRLNDIAFSGDGEPTAAPDFEREMSDVAALKQRLGLDQVKLILITNASLLHRPPDIAALEVLEANQGQVWAKLDAGTEAYYRSIDRSGVRFERILTNLLETARRTPLVIQSMFVALGGQGPSLSEVEAYVRRIRDLRSGGGKIDLVQVYTVSRTPADSRVSPLADDELERIGAAVRGGSGARVEVFHASIAAHGGSLYGIRGRRYDDTDNGEEAIQA
jgi:wyosine [tRNA(Phe)-imidazoG37] synthetase (radical SAM superfamily)